MKALDIDFDLTGVTSIAVSLQWVLSDVDWVDTPGIITGVTLTSGKASLISGISFTDDSITVDFTPYDIPSENAVETWSFDIETEHESVPEPGTILGLLTLAGLGFSSRLKRNIG